MDMLRSVILVDALRNAGLVFNTSGTKLLIPQTQPPDVGVPFLLVWGAMMRMWNSIWLKQPVPFAPTNGL